MVGLPMEAKDVEQKDLKESFPTEAVLVKWHKGEEADWPPDEDDEEQLENSLPRLRFELGKKVECRVGPDPVTGWTKGVITQLWYQEPTWPENSWAPYKIALDNGKEIKGEPRS